MSETPPPSPQPTPESSPSTPPATPSTPPAPHPPYTQTAAGEQIPDPADVEKNKVFALLSYLGILWLVPLLAAKESPFCKFHCNQGIVLSIATFVIYFGVMILNFIPYVGCVVCFLWPVILLGHLALAIM